MKVPIIINIYCRSKFLFGFCASQKRQDIKIPPRFASRHYGFTVSCIIQIVGNLTSDALINLSPIGDCLISQNFFSTWMLLAD